MTELLGGATVLIVDKDLGFVWWLGEILREAACDVVPALNCKQAVSITKKLEMKVDVVVVNPRLAGVSKMIQTLSDAGRPLKIVVIGDRNVHSMRTIPSHATLQRPSGWEQISRQEWLDRVRKILRDVHVPGAE